MKIKTNLYLLSVISVCVITVIGLVMFHTLRQINKDIKMSNSGGKLIKDIFELNIVTNEYTMYHERRMREQWHNKYNSLYRELEIIREMPLSSEHQFVVESIIADYNALGDLFIQLQHNLDRRKRVIEGNKPQVEIAREVRIEKVLTDEIMLRSQRISTQAFKWSDMMQQRIYKVEHRTNLIILYSIIAFALLSFFASFFYIRTIAGQIQKLIKGAGIIGKGDLGYRVETKTKNEIGQLTDSFNKMSDDLSVSLKRLDWLAKFPSENPNPVIRVERNGTILFANNASSIFLDYWGTKMGQSVPEDWYKHVLDALRSGKSNNYEVECNDQIFSITLAPVEEEGGEDYVNFYGLDITERKLAEAELRRIFDLSIDMICVCDINNGYFKKINPAFGKTLGYSEEELLERPFYDFIHPDDIDSTTNEVEEILATGKEIVGFENRYRCKDGSYKWLMWTARPTPEHGFTYAMAHDITERKKTGNELEQKKYYLERAQEIATIGTWELDIIKNKLVWTDENYRIFGVPEGTELTYEIFLNCIHPDDRDYVDREWKASLNKKPYDIEHRIIVDGKIKWVREKADLKFDEKGNCISGIGFTQDVTERKQAEEQIKASLQEKEVLLKEIHHRVKNNMQIMASLLRLQSQGIKDKQLLDLFNESQNRIKSMALVHEDLYSGKDLARIDLEQYARNLTARLTKSYEVDPNRVITSVNIDNVFLGVDTAIPCGLILNELFTNSLKYAFPVDKSGVNLEDKKGEIRIDCHANSAEHTLVFSDNGVGLPENTDIQETETLGLDLVRSLVDQLGGTIELNRNGGTEFKITFEV